MQLNLRGVNILKYEEGFSLIELLIVMCVIIALLAVAFPVYKGIQAKAQATAFDLQVRSLRQAAEMYLIDGGADTTWAPGAGTEARAEINASQDAWGRYLDRWPENPLGSGEFTVVIEGGEITISPRRGH